MEKQAHRVAEGREGVPDANWLHASVLSPGFLAAVLEGEHAAPFDVVISNPPFEHAFAFLYVALMMVSSPRRRYTAGSPLEAAAEPGKRLLFVLPSDFFEGSVSRRRLYRLMGLRVLREFKLGRWCYYKDRRPGRTRTQGTHAHKAHTQHVHICGR